MMLTEGLTYFKGVGPKRAGILGRAGIANCRDLLYYFPRRYLDRTSTTAIWHLQPGDGEVTIVGRIRRIKTSSGRRRPRLEAILEDDMGGQIMLIWFNGIQWVERTLDADELVAVFGKVQTFRHQLSMIHPDMDKLGDDGPQLSTGRIIALYAGSALFQRVGLTSRTFRRILYNLIKTRGLEMPEEILPRRLVAEQGLMNWRSAVRAMHFPRSVDELNAARERLKFEELFFLQLMLCLARRQRLRIPALKLEQPVDLVKRFVRSLPFTLTAGQRRAIQDIARDTSSGYQMNRLLQGDVGSGKTVVAVSALLMGVGSGCQGAIMAPTEVLAEQHFKTLVKLLNPLGVHVGFLIGGQRKRARQAILEGIADGTTQIVVGTHAIFQEHVRFRKLGVIVIDEQHRFGVQQRATLQEKGDHPHVLLMTATPIPRSLALTIYGDLDLSLITELPAGRQPIETKLFGESRRSAMLWHVQREVEKKRQAYVIYPQVEESEKTDLKDAESGYRQLREAFRHATVGLVHGKMPSEEKEAIMARFTAGDIDILVATTVVEVGIDAPNATIMVIEHAERFGLSQLHQLRGRVGRGSHKSYCILMADYRQTPEAKQRLLTLTRTTDGFTISDKDLEIRGGGDFFGTRQHGLPSFKLADLVEDAGLIETAREAAVRLLEQDPNLEHPAHETVRWYYDTFVGQSVGRLFRVG